MFKKQSYYAKRIILQCSQWRGTSHRIIFKELNILVLINLFLFFLKLEQDKDVRKFYRFMACRSLSQKIMVLIKLLVYLSIFRYPLFGKFFIGYLAIDANHKRIVGLCHILVDLRKGIGQYGIVVSREYRGLGIGRWLSSLALNKAKRMGVKYILLTVDVDNYVAISLYKKLGFRIIRKVHKCDYRYVTNEHVDCYVMILNLGNCSKC